MHELFEALQYLQHALAWAIDHADKLHHGAELYFLVRNELTKRSQTKEEEAIPTQVTAPSKKDKHKGKRR